MSARKFLVTTYHAPNKAYTRRLQDRHPLRAQPWDAHEPLTLGHPIRWVLFSTGDQVAIQSLRPGDENATTLLDPKMLKQGTVAELPSDDKTPLWVRVQELEPQNSVFEAKPNTEAASSTALRVLEAYGPTASGKSHLAWVRSAFQFSTAPGGATTYTAISGTTPLARFELKGKTLHIKALVDGLNLDKKALEAKSSTPIAMEELSHQPQHAVHLTWTQAPGWRWMVQCVHPLAFTDVSRSEASPNEQLERRTFQKALLGSGAALAGLLVLSFVLPSLFPPKEDELIPAQFAQVLMQAPAAPESKAPSASASVAQAIQSEAVQNSVSQLLKGGMSKLLAQSDFVAGSRLQGAQSVFKTSASSASATQAAVTGARTQVTTVGGEGSQSYAKGSRAGVAGQGGEVAALDMGLIDVDQGLSRDEVGKVIHAHMSEIRYCYESAMLSNPTIEGKLLVDFTIGSQGQVTRAGVKQSSLGDGRVDDCIVRRLSRWTFPKPKGGSSVAVSYPFVFKAVGR